MAKENKKPSKVTKKENKKEEPNKKANLKVNVYSNSKKQYDETKEKRTLLGLCFGIFAFLTVSFICLTYICLVYKAKVYKKTNSYESKTKLLQAINGYDKKTKNNNEEIEKIEQEIKNINSSKKQYTNIDETIKQKE